MLRQLGTEEGNVESHLKVVPFETDLSDRLYPAEIKKKRRMGEPYAAR